jgi:spore germination protein GerM
MAGDDENCGKTYPVERMIPKTAAIATAALNQLFAGPTADEAAKGYSSLFSNETKAILKSINIKNGVAYVNLVNNVEVVVPNAATSCGAASFIGQTTATLKQFSTVNKVIFAIEGKPATFYKWMQLGCGPENNNCDEAPFAG